MTSSVSILSEGHNLPADRIDFMKLVWVSGLNRDAHEMLTPGKFDMRQIVALDVPQSDSEKCCFPQWESSQILAHQGTL